MRNFNTVCLSASLDHGISVHEDIGGRGQLFSIGSGKTQRTAGMLKREVGRTWVGTYRQTCGSDGDLMHRVKGQKAKVAEWLVSALVDGVSEGAAKLLGLEYSVRAAIYTEIYVEVNLV